jgi:tetratricopeptide (TPR) repeat protein
LNIYEAQPYSKESINCAKTLNNIGLIYKIQGKLEDSLESYLRSIRIFEKIAGSESIECGRTYHQIGVIDDNLGRHK